MAKVGAETNAAIAGRLRNRGIIVQPVQSEGSPDEPIAQVAPFHDEHIAARCAVLLADPPSPAHDALFGPRHHAVADTGLHAVHLQPGQHGLGVLGLVLGGRAGKDDRHSNTHPMPIALPSSTNSIVRYPSALISAHSLGTSTW